MFSLKLNLYFENGTFVYAGEQIDSIVRNRFIENSRVLIPLFFIVYKIVTYTFSYILTI